MRGKGVALFLVAAVIGIPTYGWLPILPLAVAGLVAALVQRLGARSERPEYLLFAVWLFSQVALTLTFALADGPRMYLLPLFLFPVVLGCVVFPIRGAVLGTMFSAGLMVLAAFVVESDSVVASPPELIFPLVALLCAALFASAAREADIESRSTAVVDELTGTLNRTALEVRVVELAHQGSLTGAPVAVVLGDLDHFKQVNDQHGHAVGDEVLKEVARRLQTCLGTFESVYRIGGEEFVVLLPDADADAAMRLAERLRSAVREEPIDGLQVTMSLGVAATAAGGRFEYGSLFDGADAALYTAKRRGRDGVCLFDPGAAQPVLVDLSRPAGRRHADGVLGAVPGAGSGERWVDRLVEEHARTGNWLMRDGQQRAHMFDLLVRIDRMGHATNLVVFAALVLAGPFYGWWPIATGILAGAAFQAVESTLARFRRPEFALGIAWLGTAAVYAFGSFLIHAPPGALQAPIVGLTLLLLMNISFSAVLPPRGVLVGGAAQAVFMLVVAFGTSGQVILHDPVVIAFPLALLGAVTLIGTVVGQSAVEHRGATVVDQLTGMLNRAALNARTPELGHQVAQRGEPVALILGDLDRFKAINDEHGHAAGDAVLREIAYRLRKQMRAFDSIYRYGGEEFVVLLPGVDGWGAFEVAERLCESVRSEPVEGLHVTMSFGVAVIAEGETWSFDRLFDDADRALYEAKRGGRDRVAQQRDLVPLAS
ncbi:MAG: diguanylate cyclase [Solirubrobacteraceae bacterium]